MTPPDAVPAPIRLRRATAADVPAIRSLVEWAPAFEPAWFNMGLVHKRLGPAPVRLDPDGRPEVVWGRRVDPDRVRTVPIERPYPFDVNTWEEYEALYPGGRSIEEMSYPRAKAHRQVPQAVRAMLAARGAVIGNTAEHGAA